MLYLSSEFFTTIVSWSAQFSWSLKPVLKCLIDLTTVHILFELHSIHLFQRLSKSTGDVVQIISPCQLSWGNFAQIFMSHLKEMFKFQWKSEELLIVLNRIQEKRGVPTMQRRRHAQIFFPKELIVLHLGSQNRRTIEQLGLEGNSSIIKLQPPAADRVTNLPIQY